jgi:hypothetical protein
MLDRCTARRQHIGPGTDTHETFFLNHGQMLHVLLEHRAQRRERSCVAADGDDVGAGSVEDTGGD